MELVYIWFKSVRDLKNTEFNFHNSYDISYDQKTEKLTYKKKEKPIPKDFFGKNISNLSAIIGENGSGKTLSLEAIYGFLDNYYIQSIVVLAQYKDGKHHLRSYYHRKMSRPKQIDQISTDNCIVDDLKQHGSGLNEALHSMLEENLRIIYLNYGINVNKFNSTGYSIDLSSHEFLDNSNNSLRSTRNSSGILHDYFIEEYRRIAILLKENKYVRKTIFDKRAPNLGFYFSTQKNRRSTAVNKLFHELNKNRDFKSIIRTELKRNSNKSSDTTWITVFNPFITRLIIAMDILAYNNIDINIPSHLSVLELIGGFEKRINEEKRISQHFKTLFEFVLNSDPTDLKTQIQKNDENKIDESFLNFHNFQFILKIRRAKELFELYESITKNNKRIDKYELGFHFGVSSGELAFLSYFSRLYSVKDKILEKQHAILLIDESELHMHPSWQKKFLKYLLEYVNESFKSCKFQIILATHSPFVFSDIPIQCGIILKRNQKRNILERYSTAKLNQTFGANIHELYTDKFLLEDTLMGDFAKEKILKLITTVNRAKKVDINKFNDLNCTIKLIGEKFIRHKILETLFSRANDETKIIINNELILLKNDKNTPK